MDPFTLFALASGAVKAVKAGCQLYKDIKGVAGDVKGVLKDLDEQFHKKYEGKPVPPEARKQLNEEKQRIRELSTKNADDIYAELGEQLGAYYENYAKCIAIFEEEEKRAQQVYSGDISLGKRALQRVLMKSKLEAMSVELREIMVYHSPPELGDLYTRVNDMMHTMMEEQKIAIAKKAEIDARNAKIRKKKMAEWMANAVYGGIFLIVCLTFGVMMVVLAADRAKKYPHLGDELIPKTELQRQIEKRGYTYTGR